MASTFFGLNIGASALATYQTAVNTTANNIANVRTEGYTRRQTEINPTGAIRVNAKYGSMGSGVEASAVTQSRNLYYDMKYWDNNSSYGLFEQKLYYLDQIQTVLTDDGVQKGFSTIFSNMFKALDSVISDGPGDPGARNQFINKAQSLCTYFNQVNTSLMDIQTDCNEEIKATVDDINAASDKLAMLNQEIYTLEIRGGSANELRDERSALIDQLSKIVKVETQEVEVQNMNGDNLGATTYRVFVNGQVMIDGFDSRKLACVASEYKKNQSDGSGLYETVWTDTGMAFAATGGTAGGKLKSLFEMRDGNNTDVQSGTVAAAGQRADQRYSIKIENLAVTQVNALAIAKKGVLSIGNRTYRYDSWTAELDAGGNIKSIEFLLNENDNLLDQTRLGGEVGSRAICGESVDAMGVPYYMAQLNEFVRAFAGRFNAIEETGQTNSGEKMGTFFVASSLGGKTFDFQEDALSSDGDNYYQLTAETFSVNEKSLKNPDYFATTKNIINGNGAYELVTELKKLQENVTVFRGDNAQKFLETLLSDVSVDTNKTKTFKKNYSNLSSALETQRKSVSGVDEDEEALDLIRFQNAYNLASKMISVMSEMYDKLINETGV